MNTDTLGCQNPIPKKISEKGFTLIEVLIALTVFAIGLLALAGMQITGIRGNSTAQVVSGKNALANGVIEEFLAMEPSSPLLATAIPANDDVAQCNNNGRLWLSADLEGVGPLNACVTLALLGGLSQITVTVDRPPGMVDGRSPVVRTVVKRRL